ncbi:hypothetical protein [Leeuwenhoekiella sp. MAR_2009_132]|uniref:hypothetical protein n=1 Tax=Leeuwenhoekiella sp. MAR_2009_132 TaxID=1392489 RepID=UPI000491578D|nr:hypothetical protein [Leeuwenhoekiella sp. MAR_2009_132]
MSTAIAELEKDQTIDLAKLEANLLPELQGWKEKQLAIVKENPYVAIQDNSTYEEAKKARTTLVTARTDVQKQEKTIASKLKNFRTKVAEASQELIDITLPHETKQQEEVRRYEEIKEREKAEKERQEQERKDKILGGINETYSKWKETISDLKFAGLQKVKQELADAIVAKDGEELEEFEMDWAEKRNLLKSQIGEREKYLTEQEEARVEREKLEKEKAAFEKQQEEARAKAEAEAKAKADQEAKERAAREKADAEAKKLREAEEAKLRKEREEFKAAEEARHQKTFEIRCNRLEEVGFKSTEEMEFIYKELDLKLDKFHDDVYAMDIEEFEDFIQEAKTELVNAKAREDHRKQKAAESKAKAEQEAKERAEREAKRLEELKPDKEKALAYLNDLVFKAEPPTFNEEVVFDVIARFVNEVKAIQEAYRVELTDLK